MKCLFSLLSIVSASFIASAQDILPAQFRAALMLYNPANAGLLKEDVRLATIYQQHWNPTLANPNTFSYASLDMRLLQKKLRKGDAIGLGLSGSGYRYSIPNDYEKGNSRTVSISTSYHRGLGAKRLHHLSLGIQASFINKSQDNLLPSAAEKEVINYEDAAIGILYSGQVSTRSSIYGGVAIYHAGQPVETFFNLLRPVYRRNTAQIGWNFKANSFLSFRTNAMYHLQGSGDILSGDILSVGSVAAFTIKAKSKHPATMYIGGWYYSTEAVVPYVAAEWYNMRLGASYGLNPAPYNPTILPAASYEISLVYNGMLRKPTEHWNVPRL